MPGIQNVNGCLHRPIYGVVEASRLLSLQPARIRRWLLGYQYDYGPPGGASRIRRPPVVVRGTSRGLQAASFLDLMELLFIRAFLTEGISLQRIRKALVEASQITGQDHPFARRRFFTLQKGIFMELRDQPDAVLLELLDRKSTRLNSSH